MHLLARPAYAVTPMGCNDLASREYGFSLPLPAIIFFIKVATNIEMRFVIKNNTFRLQNSCAKIVFPSAAGELKFCKDDNSK